MLHTMIDIDDTNLSRTANKFNHTLRQKKQKFSTCAVTRVVGLDLNKTIAILI